MKRKGFTLIELLVVIAIIGLLSTLAVVSLNSARQKSRDAKKMSDLRAIQTAVEMYKSNYDALPNTSSWTNFGTAIASYLPSLPSGDSNGAIRICTTTTGYYLQAELEVIPTTKGFTGTASGVCVGNGGSAPSTLTADCNAGNNSKIFCLSGSAN